MPFGGLPFGKISYTYLYVSTIGNYASNKITVINNLKIFQFKLAIMCL